MKRIKRIIAVFLLVLVGLVVGYLVYTSSRLADHQKSEKQCSEVRYEQKKDF